MERPASLPPTTLRPLWLSGVSVVSAPLSRFLFGDLQQTEKFELLRIVHLAMIRSCLFSTFLSSSIFLFVGTRGAERPQCQRSYILTKMGRSLDKTRCLLYFAPSYFSSHIQNQKNVILKEPIRGPLYVIKIK